MYAQSIQVSFTILSLPILAGVAVFAVLRHPRWRASWCFAGVFASLALHQAFEALIGTSNAPWQELLVFSRIQVAAFSVLLISGSLLALSLHRTRPMPWEWLLVVAVFLSATTRALHYATLQGAIVPGCRWPSGMPCFAIDAADNAASGLLGAAGIVITGFLFWRAEYGATGVRRRILRRHLLAMVGLLVATGIVAFSAAYLDIGWPVPYGVLMVAGAVVATRMLVLLDDEGQPALAFSHSRKWLLWLAGLIAGVTLDTALFPSMRFPLFALIVLGIGVMVVMSELMNRTASQPAPLQSSSVGGPERSLAPGSADPRVFRAPAAAAPGASNPPDQAVDEHSDDDAPAVQVHLFGPMRVLRSGEVLNNTSQVWRSAKTRSLLAYLALKGDQGATQIELVDALWPHSGDWNGADDTRNRKNLHSYLSTLRKVLEPDGERGSGTFIERDSERLYLRHSGGLWVDMWEFECLIEAAAVYKRAGRGDDLLAALERLASLYDPTGLLPDELHLPLELVEPYREHCRQRWQWALRLLQEHHDATGDDERAARVATIMRQAAS